MGMIDSFRHERGLEDGDRYRVASPPCAERKRTAITQAKVVSQSNEGEHDD
jgi:hypothetical protein